MVAIFGPFLASFLDHFWVFGRRMMRMDQKMMWKMMWKMATVNALKWSKNSIYLPLAVQGTFKLHLKGLGEIIIVLSSLPKLTISIFLSPWTLNNMNYMRNKYILGPFLCPSSYSAVSVTCTFCSYLVLIIALVMCPCCFCCVMLLSIPVPVPVVILLWLSLVSCCSCCWNNGQTSDTDIGDDH